MLTDCKENNPNKLANIVRPVSLQRGREASTDSKRESFGAGAGELRDSENCAGLCGKLHVAIPLTRGYHALIDFADLERVSRHHWHVKIKPNGTVYAQTNVVIEGKHTSLLMHRFILEAKPGQEVDHEDTDGLHNWRTNLRLATRVTNNQNRRARPGKFKGVWLPPDRKRWRAALKLDGKQISLGSFDTEEAAARAYDTAARKHFGEFARCNFQEVA